MINEILENSEYQNDPRLLRIKKTFGWLAFLLILTGVFETVIGFYLYIASLQGARIIGLVIFAVGLALAIWQVQGALGLYKFNRANSAKSLADFSSKMGAIFLIQTLALIVMVASDLYRNFR